eukprot:scaffold712_cov404-Prasinococcus_capsulatus_cf.AAC.14
MQNSRTSCSTSNSVKYRNWELLNCDMSTSSQKIPLLRSATSSDNLFLLLDRGSLPPLLVSFPSNEELSTCDPFTCRECTSCLTRLRNS